jgi:hypothetical protein
MIDRVKGRQGENTGTWAKLQTGDDDEGIEVTATLHRIGAWTNAREVLILLEGNIRLTEILNLFSAYSAKASHREQS